jgi:hypothetical protein
VVFYVYSPIFLHFRAKEMEEDEEKKPDTIAEGGEVWKKKKIIIKKDGTHTDLVTAYSVTKNFKQQSSKAFTNIRSKLWICQYILMIIGVVITYPSAFAGQFL